MKKVAISVWNGRISPVFDASRHMVIVDVADGKIAGRREERLDDDPARKTEQIAGAGVKVLVCGAVSRALAGMLEARDVTIHPFIAGELEDVIQAYLGGGLDRPRFAMPGCCGRRGRFRGGRCRRGGGFGKSDRFSGADCAG
ncbi:MAG: NifB/NifX family molybdenum-iron cluster-binding protein [Planctomycetota bacterium]